MKSDCSHYKDSFSALIDKRLDLPDVSAVEEHLLDCADCTQHLAQLKLLCQTLSHSFSSAPGSAADSDIWSDVAGKLPNPCELVQADLSNFLDGELVSAAQEGVRGHLKECNNCLKQFRELNTTNRLIVEGLGLPPKTKVDLWPAVKTQLNDNCNVIENDLSAFIDQQMPTERHRNVTAHILECPRCGDTVRGFSRLGDLIEQQYGPGQTNGPDLIAGVRNKLRVVPFTPKEQVKPARRFPVFLVVSLLVGLFAIALLSMAVILHVHPHEISSEDVLINTAFAKTPQSPEAAVYGQ
jgi:anti-sigma factor RsiW